MKQRSPTGSYYIELPDEIVEDTDEQVRSYWLRGSQNLLQISSIRRLEGRQIRAAGRIKRRLIRDKLTNAESVCLNLPHEDHAAICFTDQQGVQWFYIYLTWADLAIFVTISGKPEDLVDRNLWPFRAVRSIARVP